jgi:hypothetical protein
MTMGREPPGVPAAMVTLMTAIAPEPMAVLLRPKTKTRTPSEMAAPEEDLPAAVAAVPVVVVL